MAIVVHLKAAAKSKVANGGDGAKSTNLVDMYVGDRLRFRRIALGMSPEQLAKALGSKVQQVQQWEAGTGRIGAARLQKLTQILGVDAAFFFQDVKPNGLHDEAH
jgi:transcriptional regulator with XRE-family HTH domain